MRVKEELARVQLHHDAGHAPDIWWLVPAVVLEDYFGCTVLARVDDQRVSLILVGCTTKVDNFHLGAYGSEPRLLDLGRRWYLPVRKMRTITVAVTFITTVNIFLH